MTQRGPLTLHENGRSHTHAAPASTVDARFVEVLDRYGNFLRRTISRISPTVLGADLDDLEQEARIRLWQALRGEREIVYPASYIYRIAISVTIRALRRVRARKEDALLDADSEERSAGAGESALQASPGSSPAAIAERREWLAKIDLALTRLAENRRVAVGLHLQGFTTTEIGNLLGWSEAKARNLVHRGLKDLRRELAAAGMEYGG